GVDPIVGSTNKGTVGDSLRVVKGMDWNDHNKAINIQKDFVVTRGGEYFFSPPVSAIKGRLAQ
ncbi:dye-decolorizing heme-containing peroxidase, partial [Marasmius sp. AFHP31]